MTTRGGCRLGLLAGRAAVGGAVYGPVLQAFEVLSDDGTWSWAEVASRSAFFAVAMVMLTAVVRPYWMYSQERDAHERVLSEGALPSGAGSEQRARRLCGVR